MSMRGTPALLWIAGTLLALGGTAPAVAQSVQPSDRVVIVVEDDDGGYRTTKNKAYTARAFDVPTKDLALLDRVSKGPIWAYDKNEVPCGAQCV